MITAADSLIPELERVLQQGSPERCAEMLSGITSLFLSGASRFTEEHVAVFDEIFARLIEDIETRARADAVAAAGAHRQCPAAAGAPSRA